MRNSSKILLVDCNAFYSPLVWLHTDYLNKLGGLMKEIIKTGCYKIPSVSLSTDQKNKIKKRCSYFNPVSNLFTTTYYTENGLLFIPLYAFSPEDLSKLLPDFKIIVPAIKSEKEVDIEINPALSLRDYQVEPVRSLIETLGNKKNAILQALPSFGKSFILPFVLKDLRKKTLIIIDRVDLVTQMSNEFKTNTVNLKLLILNSKNLKGLNILDTVDSADVVITTFQLLHANRIFLENIKDAFDMIVVDEAHVIGAKVFTHILSSFNAKYRLGLSATPTRSDGNQTLLNQTLGKNIIHGKGDLLKVQVEVVRTKIAMRGYDAILGFNACYTEFLTENLPFILEVIKKYSNRKLLIYTTSNHLQQTLSNTLSKNEPVAILNSTTKKKDREKYLEDFENGSLRILIAGTILQKGISIKKLDCIINLASQTKESLEQVIGRLRRVATEDGYIKPTPLFVDIYWGGILYNQSVKRSGFLNAIMTKSGDSFKL